MWPSRSQRPLSGTWASRPASAAVGQRRWVTDLGNRAIETVWDGTSWRPNGAQMILDRQGTIAAPVSTVLNNSNAAGSTLYTLSGGGVLVPAFPASFLYSSARFRVQAELYRTGAIAAPNTYWRWGTAGTTADTLITTYAYTAANASFQRLWIEFRISGTTLAHGGNVGSFNNSGSTTGGGEITGLTLASSYFFTLGNSAAAAGDTYQVNSITMEWLS